MYPSIKHLPDFDLETGAKIEKANKILENVDWDFSKLTEKEKIFLKQLNFIDEDGSFDDSYLYYWDAIGPGCSWYCGGGPDSVRASSYLESKNSGINYLPDNVHDLSYKTAWVEGVEAYGTGEYLVFYFRSGSPRITSINVVNGYVKSPKHWQENSRVKRLKMYIDDTPFAILNLEDCRNEQRFDFEPIGKYVSFHDVQNDGDYDDWEEKNKWTMKFEILEVYKGDKYDDTAITEIFFDGFDVHCFAAGTKILMNDNSLKNIELIQAGDFVKSYDFANERLVNSRVAKLIPVKHSRLVKLKFIDNEIVVTTDHPFWTDKKCWAAVNSTKANADYVQDTKVEKLSIGDNIFLPEKNVFLELLDMEIINDEQLTYTVEFSENDNFVANGFLVKTEIPKRINPDNGTFFLQYLFYLKK
jgi:hypothetical protein